MSVLGELITRSVSCNLCGKPGYMTCDCWQKCRCGWSHAKGESCHNPKCGGDGEMRATHPGSMRAANEGSGR